MGIVEQDYTSRMLRITQVGLSSCHPTNNVKTVKYGLQSAEEHNKTKKEKIHKGNKTETRRLQWKYL